MAFIGIATPLETARLLSTLKVPGERTPVNESHITMVHLGKEAAIETLAKAITATYEVVNRTAPFVVSTSSVSSFEDHGDGVPVICPIDSDPLHALQAEIRAALDASGVEYSKKHPNFTPHVTLSYSPEPIEDRQIQTIEWGVHELVLWGGDKGAQTLIVTFPFKIVDTALRLARRWGSSVEELRTLVDRRVTQRRSINARIEKLLGRP